MTDFQSGEIVDVTIKGARVHEVFLSGVVLRLPSEPETTFEVPLADEVTLERVAPAEWPPRRGDLWSDGAGELWFAIGARPTANQMVRVSGASYGVEHVLDTFGPLALVHREGESE